MHALARELNGRGHPTTVITSHMRGAGPDADFVRRVGRSRVIYSNGSFARVTTGWRLGRQLEALLREGRFDVVHVHGGLAPTFGLLAPRAAWRLGIPVVATFHSWFRRSVGYRVFHRPLQRWLDRHAAVIAVSEPVVRALSRYFEADWRIIPNGVSVGYFHPNGRRPGDALRRGPRLLFLGRLDPRNGLDTMLAAMPRILAAYPAAQLVVAGDGPLRRYYEARAQPLGASVRFAGRVFEDRPAYYGTADLYLCPTTKASFGVTLLEAMACGTPMVISDITGFRELVNGGAEAVLVPEDDAEAWSRAVIELIGNTGRRAAMSAAGLAKAERFAWPRVAEQVLGVYRQVTG